MILLSGTLLGYFCARIALFLVTCLVPTLRCVYVRYRVDYDPYGIVIPHPSVSPWILCARVSSGWTIGLLASSLTPNLVVSCACRTSVSPIPGMVSDSDSIYCYFLKSHSCVLMEFADQDSFSSHFDRGIALLSFFTLYPRMLVAIGAHYDALIDI